MAVVQGQGLAECTKHNVHSRTRRAKEMCICLIVVSMVLLAVPSNSLTTRTGRANLPGRAVTVSQMPRQGRPTTAKAQERKIRTTGQTFCFEDKCICREHLADCSHNDGNLTFVPRFKSRESIYQLDFSFNHLRSILTHDFFENATYIRWLNLSYNNLASIHPDAFRALRALETLYLDGNNLKYLEITHKIFPSPKLKNLVVSSNQLGPIPDDFATPDSAPELSILNLNNNSLTILDVSNLFWFKKLKTLYAKNNKIEEVVAGKAATSLTDLLLDNNKMKQLPESCDPGRPDGSRFPNLTKLVLALNYLEDLDRESCFPSLQWLDLSNTRITRFTTDMFNKGGLPSLARLYLNNIQPIKTIQKFAFRHPKLWQLTLAYCYFSTTILSPMAFAGNPELAFLLIGHSQGSSMTDKSFSTLFGSIPNLQVFLFKKIGIRQITRKTFNQLKRLTRLEMDRNSIKVLPDGAFDELVNLTQLVLSDNELETISERSFSVETRGRLVKLDLSGNPFACDCSILWFRNWYLSQPSLFEKSYGKYTCGDDFSLPLLNLSLREQSCFFNRGRRNTCNVAIRRNAFKFDAFVSYAEEDFLWVRKHLIPHLEGQLGLRLCIHQRDFTVGKNIVDNIVDSVDSSRKTIVVFSRSYIVSQWCQFELAYCLSHVLDNDDTMIVICRAQMTSLKPTSAMVAVLNTMTYIQWEKSHQGRAVFWSRLKMALGQVNVSNT